MKGWVYIVTNIALEGLVKVGFTEKDPQYRARSLSNAAHPYPCIVEYEALVNEPREIERNAHKRLAHKNENKEWFKCSVDEAASIINEVAKGNMLHEQHHYIERIENDNYLWESQLIEWIRFSEAQSNNGIATKPPKKNKTLKDIKEINLCDSGVREIPASLSKLDNLENLLLMKNSITYLPKNIGELQNLKYLHLGKNQLNALPNSLCELSNMESLYLQENQLEALPENIGNLSKLKKLSLFINNIGVLPDSLTRLENLETLWLTGNNLKELPKDFSNLINLKELNLTYNQLHTFPESLFELPNLERLYLSENNLNRKNKPKLKDFSSLKELDL